MHVNFSKIFKIKLRPVAKILAAFVLVMQFSNTSLAQQVSTLKIINNENNDPVAYAEVGTGSFVYYADVDGVVRLEIFPGDSLLFSRIGFLSQELVYSGLNDTIRLEPQKIELPEISIGADPAFLEVGFHRSKILGWSLAARSGTSMTMATLIQPAGIIGKINQIFIGVKNQLKGTKYRICIFETTEDLKPGKLIYETTHISKNNRNLLKVNVLEADIVFSERGVFAGIRILESEREEGATIKLTKTYGTFKSYFLYNNMWFEYDNLNPEYNFTFRIGLEISKD